MSPLNVRRYRAERLLRGEFEALRGKVISGVRARLRGSGATLDESDLEACYAMAWQGLYMAVLDGQEIDNPAGWLVQVTFRRAVDEYRSRLRRDADLQPLDTDAHELDLAAELDDRARLRHLFEGLRRLNAREREAAVLCYLQGLSRAQAAERMGVSEARMRKLMEGGGVGRPGVAGKVGALVQTIRDGGWCEEQGSLMRALAFGVLDPDGERYQLALLHRGDCPSCRAYVTSLRGLAATLPPVFLPWGLGATAGATSAAGAAGAGAGASGFAGGGWLFAGGAKLAAGCVLALSVGAGCVALDMGAQRKHTPTHRHRVTQARSASESGTRSSSGSRFADLGAGQPPSSLARSATLKPAAQANHEFGPEQALAGTRAAPTAAAARAVTSSAGRSRSSAEATGGSSVKHGSRSSQEPTSPVGGTSAAEREFSPG